MSVHNIKAIQKGIQKFYKKHGKTPSQKSGDAYPYVGYETTWTAVNQWLRNNGPGSLPNLGKEMGLDTPRADHDLKAIKKGIQEFYKEHGKTPTERSGDACPYVGYKATWEKVAGWLRTHDGSLSQLCKEMGLDTPRADHDLEAIKKGIQEFYKEHGKPPSTRAGNATPYVGYKTTWMAVDQWFKKNSHGSLSQLCTEMGFDTFYADHDLKAIKKGIQEFYKEHGKTPTERSGDACPYVGYKTTWKSVTQWIGSNGYGSLSQLCMEMGFDTFYADHDLEAIKKGIQEFYKKHGKTPGVLSGDACSYVGYKTTWVAVNGWLSKNEHGSLSQLCREMGLYDTTRWTVARLRDLIEGMLPHLSSMTAAERASILIQCKALSSQGGRLGKLIAQGHVTSKDLQDVLDGGAQTDSEIIKDLQERGERNKAEGEETGAGAAAGGAFDLGVSGQDLLRSASFARAHIGDDEEAVQFLLESHVHKLWAKAYENESGLRRELRKKGDTPFSEEVRTTFLAELKEARAFKLPKGYSFRRDGKLCFPTLMQKRTVVRLKKMLRMCNLSGTGAGKTLSAVLASRALGIGTQPTVIVCPNSVVGHWKDTILSAFPDSEVHTCTLNPPWGRNRLPKYLILNYEQFSQRGAVQRLKLLADSRKVGFVVIDEVQFVKRRAGTSDSRRSRILEAFVGRIAARNPRIYVLGMSATPVVNDLSEAASLLEIVRGESFEDLGTSASLSNAVRFYQQFVRYGIRWLPRYDALTRMEERTYSLGRRHFSKIRKQGSSPLQVEQLLTKLRLPLFLERLAELRKEGQVKVVFYTHYVTGIVPLLRKALVRAGYSVGVFTQHDKSGLRAFLEGDLEILIGSQVIGTGVDGLQYVSRDLFFNSLPWTGAERQQILGRLVRTGQGADDVRVFIPVDATPVGDDVFSYTRHRINCLDRKQTLGDAVADGSLPSDVDLSPKRVMKMIRKWLERLEKRAHEVPRNPKNATFPTDTTKGSRKGSMGETSRGLRLALHSKSSTNHRRYQEDPEGWRQLVRGLDVSKNKSGYKPIYDVLRVLREKQAGTKVADLGCGLAHVHREMGRTLKVRSFDHVAVNEHVEECDIAEGLSLLVKDGEMDVAVLCQALWGCNWHSNLKQAARILRPGGELLLVERRRKNGFFTGDRLSGDEFVALVERFGFRVVRPAEARGFLLLRARRVGTAKGAQHRRVLVQRSGKVRSALPKGSCNSSKIVAL